jgi:hypothetical protein
MRVLSTEIQTVLNSKGYSSYWLADIHLPAQGDLPAHDFYISDSAVYANGHYYQPLLRNQKPRMMQSLGKAPDGGSITIDNIEGEIGRSVLARGRDLTGAKFVLWKAFLLEGEKLGLDKWMEGEIRAALIAESDQTITFQLNSDLLRRQSVMGAFMLSQRCIVPFNIGGALSPAESRCGWQTAQGGNPDFCDKSEDGENGCRAHGNLHRMAAVPAVAASSHISTIPFGDGGGTGFPHGGNDTCFLGGTPILLPFGESKPIEQITVGQEIMAPVYNEETGEDSMEPRPVEAVWVNTVSEWLEVHLPHGNLHVTPRHRFYRGSGIFTPIGDIEVGQTVRIGLRGGFEDCRIVDKIKRTGQVKVYNLSIKYARTYFANLVAVHNVKPIFM